MACNTLTTNSVDPASFVYYFMHQPLQYKTKLSYPVSNSLCSGYNSQAKVFLSSSSTMTVQHFTLHITPRQFPHASSNSISFFDPVRAVRISNDTDDCKQTHKKTHRVRQTDRQTQGQLQTNAIYAVAWVPTVQKGAPKMFVVFQISCQNMFCMYTFTLHYLHCQFKAARRYSPQIYFFTGPRNVSSQPYLNCSTRKSRVRFPMVSLEFFTDIILSVALWPWGRLSL
jgi:hypothetical protein